MVIFPAFVPERGNFLYGVTCPQQHLWFSTMKTGMTRAGRDLGSLPPFPRRGSEAERAVTSHLLKPEAGIREAPGAEWTPDAADRVR